MEKEKGLILSSFPIREIQKRPPPLVNLAPVSDRDIDEQVFF